MATLPQVGAYAVILGMAAFNSNAKSVNSQLEQIGRTAYYLERTSRSAMSGVQQSTNKAFEAIKNGALVAGGALMALGAASIVVGNKYNAQIGFMGAVSESTSAQIAKLDGEILELSRHSTEGALGLASAASEMVKAGFSAEQMSGSTLKAVNDLIVASNGELKAADAAVLAQVGFAAFHASVETTANAATAAVQRSTLTFTEFADAMRQGGGAAANAGLSINEFAAIVGVAGKQLNSGSMIGTGFRVMLQRLQDPSKENIALMQKYGISLYDVNGAQRPFFDVLVSLEQQFGKGAIAAGRLTEAQRDQAMAAIFGTRSSQTVIALLNQGTAAYLEMLAATERLTASQLAAAVMNNTSSVLKILRNSVLATGIAFDKGLDPFVKAAAKGMLLFVQGLPLKDVQDFGRAVGYTAYNALANFGTIIRQVIVPILNAALRPALLAAAAATLLWAKTLTGNLLAALVGVGAATASWAARVVLATASIVAASASAGLAVAAFAVRSTVALGSFVIAMGTAAAASARTALIVAAGAASSAARVVAAAALMAGRYVAAMALMALAGLRWATASALQFIAAGAAMMMFTGLALLRATAISIAWGIMAVKAMDRFVATTIIALANAGRAFTLLAIRSITAAAAMTAAWVAGALPAMLAALTAMGAAILPFLAGMAAIAAAAGLLAAAWANNWGDIQGITQKAISWIVGKLNDFLDALSQLPLIGEHIGNARAAMGRFFEAVPGWASTAQRAVGDFVGDAVEAFKGLKNIEMPAMHDFAADLEAANKSATELADAQKDLAAHRVPEVPGVDTEPGSWPDTGTDSAADKLEKATDKMKELLRDFNDDVVKETRNVAADVAELYADAFADINKALTEAEESVNQVMQDIGKRVREMNDERDLQQATEARRKALEDRLEIEERLRAQGLENEAVARRRDLEDFMNVEDAKRRIREDNFDREQADAERARNLVRDNENIVYEATQELRENNLKAEQDAAERSLDIAQNQAERALTIQIEAAERALEAQQDAQERALKARQDAEERAHEDAQAAAKIGDEAGEERAVAQSDYNRAVASGVKQSIAQARLNEALRKISEKEAGQREDLADRQKDETADLSLAARHEAERLAQQQAFDAQSLALDAENDGKKLALRAAHEQAVSDLDAEHQHRRQELADTLDREARERKRAREIEDRLFAEQQTRDKVLFDAKEDARALSDARTREDAERARIKAADELERAFKEKQDKERDKLDKELEQESFDRKLQNIYTERDERIQNVQTALDEERKRIQEGLANQVMDLRNNLGERLATIREQYIDKLDDIAREGGAAIMPAVNEITGTIQSGLDGIRDAAQRATLALAEAFGAAEKLRLLQDSRTNAANATGDSGRDWWADKNFALGNGMSDADASAYADSLASKQYGGMVGGRVGQATPIMAHGGERFEGIGAYGASQAAIRAFEAMASRGIGAGTTNTNTTNYNVNASYGRVQPEGSIRRDLSGLVQATRG